MTIWVEPSQPASPSLQPSVLLEPEMEQDHDPGPVQPVGQPHAAGVKYPATLPVDGQPALGVRYRVRVQA